MPAERLNLGTADGRRAFGADAANYEAARPLYPDWVYALLRERCGLKRRTRTFEIGAGTGQASRPLITNGASPLFAIEPDERMAAVLRERTHSEGFEVLTSTFEDADLPAGRFDLGVSATAFHWLDQQTALAKVATLLRAGGWWAMWWNVFGDPGRPDPFHDATRTLLSTMPTNPSNNPNWKHPFGLDEEARLGDLRSAEAFDDIAVERREWTLTLDADQIRALYASYSQFSVLPETERKRMLDGLRDIASTQFNGKVERNMTTAVYTARRR